MNRERKKEIRSKSMLGVVLFGVGAIGAITAVVIRSTWIAGAAAVFLVIGAAMLLQVGKALR